MEWDLKHQNEFHRRKYSIIVSNKEEQLVFFTEEHIETQVEIRLDKNQVKNIFTVLEGFFQYNTISKIIVHEIIEFPEKFTQVLSLPE